MQHPQYDGRLPNVQPAAGHVEADYGTATQGAPRQPIPPSYGHDPRTQPLVPPPHSQSQQWAASDPHHMSPQGPPRDGQRPQGSPTGEQWSREEPTTMPPPYSAPQRRNVPPPPEEFYNNADRGGIQGYAQPPHRAQQSRQAYNDMYNMPPDSTMDYLPPQRRAPAPQAQDRPAALAQRPGYAVQPYAADRSVQQRPAFAGAFPAFGDWAFPELGRDFFSSQRTMDRQETQHEGGRSLEQSGRQVERSVEQLGGESGSGERVIRERVVEVFTRETVQDRVQGNQGSAGPTQPGLLKRGREEARKPLLFDSTGFPDITVEELDSDDDYPPAKPTKRRRKDRSPSSESESDADSSPASLGRYRGYPAHKRREVSLKLLKGCKGLMSQETERMEKHIKVNDEFVYRFLDAVCSRDKRAVETLARNMPKRVTHKHLP